MPNDLRSVGIEQNVEQSKRGIDSVLKQERCRGTAHDSTALRNSAAKVLCREIKDECGAWARRAKEKVDVRLMMLLPMIRR